MPTPDGDQTYLDLIVAAIEGRIRVYFAKIPVGLLRPFDAAFDPAAHTAGREAIARAAKRLRAGKADALWVYPAGSSYIFSDDYITWAVRSAAGTELIPAWVLGEPTIPGCVDVMGPVKVANVKTMLGVPARRKAEPGDALAQLGFRL